MSNKTENFSLPSWLRSWEWFWFTPMDPTPLALVRIMCGMIVLYTFVVYSFILPDMMGKDAWVDLELRQQLVRDRPIVVSPLQGSKALVKAKTPEEQAELDRYRKRYNSDLRAFGLAPPKTDWERQYLDAYTELWGQPPPAYAESPGEAEKVNSYINEFRVLGFAVDPRVGGLRMPQNKWEESYLKKYMTKWRVPPPAYPKDEAEAAAIHEFMLQEGVDPRYAYARGMPGWSIWMHVTDPRWMIWVQGAFVLSALLFTLGLGTRVTAALTWFASLNYLHRNAQVMFGADTMINVLLLYLTIGPSGAALSLDRLVTRWWRGGTVPPPAPSVTANLAIRLLQIHVCIIYFVAGISKLQGTSWWNGTALWMVIANYEFAPMQFSLYNDLLRFIARDQLSLEAFTTMGCYFTLAFEIGYPFLIWLRRTRWVFLGAAILLHGMIGMFMGLKTFSFIMLVMNMAFLRPGEVQWVLGLFRRSSTPRPLAAPQLETVATAATAAK